MEGKNQIKKHAGQVLGWALLFGGVFLAGYYDALWEDSEEGRTHRHFLHSRICPNCILAKREKQPVPEKFPDSWRDILASRVANYHRLPETLQHRLEPLILTFLEQVKFTSPEGVKITDQMKVSVAGEACILVLSRGWKPYRHLREVQILAHELWRPGAQLPTVGTANGRRVQLVWKSTLREMLLGAKGSSIVLHEFAHIIDFASNDGKADGLPLIGQAHARKQWAEFLPGAYQRACQAGGLSHVNPPAYDTTSQAEFFACASTVFIERPHALKREWPELYRQLKVYYGLNPVAWSGKTTKSKPDENFFKTFIKNWGGKAIRNCNTRKP